MSINLTVTIINIKRRLTRRKKIEYLVQNFRNIIIFLIIKFTKALNDPYSKWLTTSDTIVF